MARKKRQRYFLTSGEEVPGVTTILNVIAKPALVQWANRMGLQGIDTTKYVDDLATIGTAAHAIIAGRISQTPVDLRDYTPNQVDKAENSVLSYLEWEKHQQMETVVAETPLVSQTLRYGGTPDWFGRLDGRPVLLDFKTSKGIYNEHFYQLGAYWNLLREQGHEIDEVRILRVGRESSEGFEQRVIPGDRIPDYFEVFQAALELYYAIRNVEKT